MSKKVLNGAALVLGVLSLVFAFTGLPWTYDTEPLIALGLVLLAIAGLMK